MAKSTLTPTDQTADSTPGQSGAPTRKYRLVNRMGQKVVVNIVVNGVQESIELGIQEKSRPYSTADFGPHAETLRRSRHLMIEAC